MFDKEAVRLSRSAWDAKLKWNFAPLVTNSYNEILQAERLFQRVSPVAAAESGRATADSRAIAATTQTEETEQDCVIVSISGAKRVSRRAVDGVLTEFQQLPHIYVNGDYLRTRHLENGYPVFVKIHGDYHSTNERICLIMGGNTNHWSFRTSADRRQRLAAANGNLVRTFAHIRIPPDSRSRQLDELASAYDLKVRVPVPGRARGKDHCETCQVSLVSLT